MSIWSAWAHPQCSCIWMSIQGEIKVTSNGSVSSAFLLHFVQASVAGAPGVKGNCPLIYLANRRRGNMCALPTLWGQKVCATLIKDITPHCKTFLVHILISSYVQQHSYKLAVSRQIHCTCTVDVETSTDVAIVSYNFSQATAMA